MNPSIARGFLVQMLNLGQVKSLADFEGRLPQGRYLMLYEVARKFGMELKKSVSDAEANSMEQTWIDFCRGKNIDQYSTIGDHEICSAWMEYAHSHYRVPLPTASARSWENE